MRMIALMAWRNVLRNPRRSILTATMMAIGVAVCMAIVAMQAGMYSQMRDVMISQTLGQVSVHDPDYPGRRQLFDAIDDADALVTSLRAVDGVTVVAPRLFGSVLLGSDTRTEGAQLIGVAPAAEVEVRNIGRRLRTGAWLDDAPAGGVVLGADLAERLGAELGDSLVAVTQAADGSLGNELYTVVGTVATGTPSIDRNGAFVHLEDLRRLMVLEGRVHEIVVNGDDDDDDTVTALASAVTAAAAGHEVVVRPWWIVDPSAATLFGMQQLSSLIIVGFFFGISAVGVVNTMLMSVFERTRELGMMRALGMRPREIVALVIVESLGIAAVAVVVGGLVGAALDAWLVIVGIDLTVKGEGWSMASMTFDPVIHGEVTVDSVVYPVVGVFVCSVVAAIWPAVRAARLQPLDALREG